MQSANNNVAHERAWEETFMAKKILFLIMMSFSVAFGGFWALQAQDPPPQTPPSQVKTDPPTVSAQQTVQTDLSGTYTGTFNCDALGLTGDTTLTITGNEFTTADGKTGRIVASTTGGYTAVALQMGGTTTAATTPATTPAAPPVIVSMRARKSGTRLILTPAAGTAMKCSFTPTRVARGRRTPRTPAATGTEVSAPATEPAAPTESPMPSQTPAPSPSPSPTVSPTPRPAPSPTEPAPSPMPTPSPAEPAPSPTPTPSPTEPAPSPTPTPSPTPSPSPRS